MKDLDLKTPVVTDEGAYLVSTVQLPFDHGFFGHPENYETMVFDYDPVCEKVTSWADHYCRRYATKEEAIAGHTETVEALKNGELELY